MTTPDGRGAVPVSVLVSALDRTALLARRLDGLRARTRVPAEVVVVDQGGATAG